MINTEVKKASVNQSKKLGVGTKIGYGIGQLTDSIPTNLFLFFFVFFLTDIAGVKPAMAGLISLLACFWDAITDPIIGYFSDNLRTKYGRRRPFILVASFPIGFALFLMFTTVSFAENIKLAYYIIMTMFFYTAYTCYYIPFMSLGAEITTDYNERTSVRYYCLVFQLLGLLIASSGTMMLVEKFTASTGNIQIAWSTAAGIFGLVAIAAGLIGWYFTRGKEPIITDSKVEKGQSFKQAFVTALSIKSIRILALAVLIYAIGFSITCGIFVFLMENNMQLDGGQQVAFWTFNSFFGIAAIPISNMLGIKMGKRKAYIYIILLAAFIQISYTLFNFTFVLLLVFAAFVSIGHNTYFGLFQSMMYDCSEVYEYKTGLKNQGTITSIIFLFQKIGFALGMWLLGVIMDISGYIGGAPEQTIGALRGIKMLATVYAPALYAISALCIVLYKLDGKTFASLRDALEKKKNNEQYDDSSFKSLI